jgi:2-methylisocitrate lyase-like PEP mutase family enzyme
MSSTGHEAEFYKLHQSGTFVLVNVHDVGTALLAEAAGAKALGTTSGGIAYTSGKKDAVGALTRSQSIEHEAQICAAVDIPISIDAENGWGHSPEAVAETIRLLVDCGAAGASIEDWSGDSDIGFYESLERLRSFAKVGADCLYAPGPTDEASHRRIVAEAGGPVNALFHMNCKLTIDDASDWGIRRVSVGSSLYQATMAVFLDMVTKAVSTGVLDVDIPPLDYEFIESLSRCQQS